MASKYTIKSNNNNSKLLGRASTQPESTLNNSNKTKKLRLNNRHSIADPLNPEYVPPLFSETPYIILEGHTDHIVDLSWSNTHFLLTSSLDKSVRLWHISQKDCVCTFKHPDVVTAIAFDPRDDHYFMSTSMDSRIRIWNIPGKRVALWHETDKQNGLLTTADYCSGGNMIAVGTYTGSCLFYNSEDLSYHTQTSIKKKAGKKNGSKISGIVSIPCKDQILVTCDDSLIRIYNMNDFSLYCKLKGAQIHSSRMIATASYDGNYVVCGSNNGTVCVWNIKNISLQERTRRDFERRKRIIYKSLEVYQAHGDIVTVATFAPYETAPGYKTDLDSAVGEIITTADAAGNIFILLNKT